MNKVILTGNLVADPEVKTTQSGNAVCSFRIGVQRRYRDASGERQSDFINIVAWRQLAELCGKYLAKGRKVGIIGALQSRSYDAQDGSKRYVTEVVADEVEFLSSRGDAAPAASSAASAPPTNIDGYQEVDDDELPF